MKCCAVNFAAKVVSWQAGSCQFSIRESAVADQLLIFVRNEISDGKYLGLETYYVKRAGR